MKVLVTGAGRDARARRRARRRQRRPRRDRLRPHRARRQRRGGGQGKDRAGAARRGDQLCRLDRRRRRRGGRGGGAGGQRPAPGIVAAAAATVDASVVYVSSDYVFDGAKGAPYVETDQTAPLSAYGRTKLAGEEATAAANKRHFVVRSSWLFGIGGSNFVETMLRLATDPERGAGRPRPGRLADLHLAPRLRHRPPDRGSRVRHPPHGRRRQPAPGTSSPARSSSRPRSSAGCSPRPPRCSDGRRRARPTRPWSASASTRSSCPLGATASPPTSPSAPAGGRPPRKSEKSVCQLSHTLISGEIHC